MSTNDFEFKLKHSWTLWFHNLKSDDWTISGFEKIQDIHSLSDFWIVINNIDIHIGMYYLMRDNILPIWDHPDNINGYNYTFKCTLNDTSKIFQNIACLIIGETMNIDNSEYLDGISTSPKSKNNIIRLWSNKQLDQKNTIYNTYFNIKEWREIKN